MNATGAQTRNGEKSSGTPPLLPGPFGYSFGSGQDTPYDAGPAPPPGPSLLDDSESNMLDSFFTTLNTGQLDMEDSWFNAISQDKGANSFALDWSEGPPPTFEGSTTSLSPATALPYNATKRTNGLTGGLGPDSDILAAAQMLYANGMNTTPNFGTRNYFPSGSVSGITASQHQNTLKQEDGNPNQRLLRPQHTTSFSLDQPRPADPQTATNVRTLRWGSDAGFVDQGYLRPPDIPNVEEQTHNLLDHVTVLIPEDSTSATNTRAPSPVRDPENANNQDWGGTGNPTVSHLRQDGHDATDSSLLPRKRLKAKFQSEDNPDDTSTPPKMKRPKSSSGKQRRGSSDVSSRKPNKAPRENLTEEQKRTNHILSEQKRRNLIKNGFEELCSLVPELRGGGFSKSAMLLQAADYLSDLLKGNDMLRQQLNQLKAMNGYLIPR